MDTIEEVAKLESLKEKASEPEGQNEVARMLITVKAPEVNHSKIFWQQQHRQSQHFLSREVEPS